jgi:beta-glucosidase
VTSVNYTAMAFKDGTEGVQQYNYVSGFPDASAMAMTWDKDAIYQQCKATGQEFYLNGFNVISGPVASPLGRTAWGGRLVESLGADSYLSGIVLGKGTEGFQDAGVVVAARVSQTFSVCCNPTDNLSTFF